MQEHLTPPSQQLDEITSLIREDLASVERMLHDGMRSVAPLISEVGDYTLDGGGKRVRPVLVLLAARLCGYRGPRSIQVAAAAELLHTATLVHDDVVDSAETRRGRPSVNAQFGTRLAILVGDFLLATSSQMLVEDGNIDILGAYADTIRKMAEGEVLQLTNSFDPEIPESLYLEVIGRKTATLMATSSESGAILGDVTKPERRAMREYGWQAGLAFQLVDDALDYASTDRELGKASLTDLAEGKITLPLLTVLKRCTVGERDSITALVKSFARTSNEGGAPDPNELARVADAVAQHHGVETTLERARICADTACSSIESFVDSDAKRALFALAKFVVARRS
jgi:octaprenyl-diphosphate synthase